MTLPSLNLWVVIPGVAACVFIIVYMWFDRFVTYFHTKSLGSREEIIRKLDLMFVKIERERLTWAMLVVSFGPAALIFLLLWPNVVPALIFGAFFMILGFRIPLMVVNILYERRCSIFVNQMVDGMTVMANGVRSGLSVTQSMDRVVLNLPNPIRQEFRLVLSEIQLGRTIEEALSDLGERIPRPDVQMFVTSVNILKETGGNMAETFQTIMYTVRERQKIEKRIEALTAQGVAQGVILTMVPFLLLIVFYFVNPEGVTPMFTRPLGWVALFLMLVLQAIGGIIIRKIVKIRV